jgi:hypothetical protein
MAFFEKTFKNIDFTKKAFAMGKYDIQIKNE